MPKYFTRIQLHEAQPLDFEKLDNEMRKAAFIRVKKAIPSGETTHSLATENGQTTTEYNLDRNISLLDVNDVVSRAARKTGKKYSYTVIKDKRGTP